MKREPVLVFDDQRGHLAGQNKSSRRSRKKIRSNIQKRFPEKIGQCVLENIRIGFLKGSWN
jgi:hypothetical protein